MQERKHQADFCVVGGGMAGLCAALAAARHGLKTILVHDRPVLGGNASSEIRMWICGCNGDNLAETGILEEIVLENLHRNPMKSWSIWDSVLYGTALREPNLTLLLNCSVNTADVDGATIRSVRGWQLTSETWHTVEAACFADCSGDGILAALAGADFTYGREGRSLYQEAFGPDEDDRVTMGMSCLIQMREYPFPIAFHAPAWAKHYTSPEDLPRRNTQIGRQNFWWIELCDPVEPIHNTEHLRDELVASALGIWDYIKNRDPSQDAANWDLEWMGFLPGKRESRRCIGDHVLTEPDVSSGGRFDDVVAYGGWTMDDHVPGGLLSPRNPTCHHPAPQPYGIPYRTLYSRNINNLFFAGRNHSATHAAFSSTRVMGTCATMGQAVGTAAALAARHGTSPRGIYERHIPELQQMLMEDDCFLPGLARQVPDLARNAALSAASGDPEPLRDGVDRPVGSVPHAWSGPVGTRIAYTFGQPTVVTMLRAVFDSNLSDREIRRMPCYYPLSMRPFEPPAPLVKAFRIELLKQGTWTPWREIDGNHRRMVRMAMNEKAEGVALVPLTTWGGNPTAALQAFDVS